MKPALLPTDSPPIEAPLICVVIPAYNAEKYLRQTLESVRAQTLENWECIVMDDGSRDSTAQIAQEVAELDARVRLLQQPNSGVSVARNNGFSRVNANTEFVAFLDADDLWEPETLQVMTETLRASPEAVAAQCNAFYIDGEGQLIREGVLEDSMRRRFYFDGKKVRRSTENDATTFAHAVTNCPIITTGCVVMRRAAFERIEGFNPRLQQGEDWDVWVQLARLSDIPFVNRPFLAYRRHPNNSSIDRRRAMAQVQILRRRMVDAAGNTPAQRQLALKAYRAFYWFLACERYLGAWRLVRERRLKEAAQRLAFALANTALAIKGRP